MKTVVIGGGPAGMMAAISAAHAGNETVLIEKNEKLGKKLFITGKGRCNLTNTADTDRLFFNIVNNPKFMYSAIYGFDNNAVWDFFENEGLKLKEERGGRVFPVSDKSSDVIKTLERALKKAGVKVYLNTEANKVISGSGERIKGVVLSDGKKLDADNVVIATGGLSYASTGSTGDGYKFARSLGHSIIKPVPALVPLIIKEDFCRQLSGLSLKNVELKVIRNGKESKPLFKDRGEMLFTHEGISGPLVLSAGSYINKALKKDADKKSGSKDGLNEGDTQKDIVISVDLKPALSPEMLNDRIRRDLVKYSKKEFKNSLSDLLPSSLIPVVVRLSDISPEKQSAQVNGEETRRLAALLKDLRLHVEKTAGFNEAIITAGGVNVKEIDASTMQSKIIKGLYFAGEVIDVDALTGGYNLQIAWSTGHLAGLSCAGD